MTRAAEHYSVCSREIKHLARLLRRGDISVGKHWNPDSGSDIADRLVLGVALVEVRARAAVHRQSLNAAGLGDLCDLRPISRCVIPTSANLERHWHVHCANNRFENMGHERFVFEQRGATELPANLFGGTTHVDINDLRAEVHVEARSF